MTGDKAQNLAGIPWGTPMVVGTNKAHSSSWRVILRAEQFVWHNKEFPATFTPLKDQAGFMALGFLPLLSSDLSEASD